MMNHETPVDLIEEAAKNGITIFYDGQLRLNFQNGKPPSEILLNKIRTSKVQLGAFLSQKTEFEVMPVQQWWIDEESDVEFKQQLYFIEHFQINGPLDLDAYREAIMKLIERHESLRTCYVKTDNGVRMRLLNTSVNFFYSFAPKDSFHSDREADNFFRFRDHEFDLWNGPLFLVRMLQIAEDTFILSLKAHHSIFDAWSRDVLFRDLKAMYFAIKNKSSQHGLKPLKFQYKDFAKIVNNQRLTRWEEQKKYWDSIYPGIPPPLVFPNENFHLGSGGASNCDFIVRSLPPALNGAVSNTAAIWNVSKFVVLQATVVWFLFKLTGQRDLLIGTQVFGRNQLPFDIEDQIGCYAQAGVIRTLLSDNDSFNDCVVKVAKGNEKFNRNTAYPLLEWVANQLKRGETLATIWRIFVVYTETKSFVTDNKLSDNLQISSIPLDKPPIINFSMKLEFVQGERDISMRFIYNVDQFSSSAIDMFLDTYDDELRRIINANC